MNSFRLLPALALSVFLAVASAVVTRAQPFFNPTSGNWALPANWSTGQLPTSSQSASLWNQSAIIDTPGATAGAFYLAGASSLTVQDGGSGTFAGIYVNMFTTGDSSLTITGEDSVLTSTVTDYVGWMPASNALITVADGGHYAATQVNLGYYTDSTHLSTLRVTGEDSLFTTTGNLSVGYFGRGSFELSGGATAITGSASIASGSIGDNGATVGTATITGTGTSWQTTGSLTIGAGDDDEYYTRGSLTVSDGANLTVTDGSIVISRNGTFYMGTGGNSGTISAAGIVFGDTWVNTGKLIFNHSDNLTFSTPISGYGEVIKNGSGRLTLTGANTFSHLTINAGTVRFDNATAFGGNLRVVNLAGGGLELNGIDQALYSLKVTADSSIRFLGASTLSIYAFDAATDWDRTIELYDFVLGSDKIHIGSSLTSEQLAQFHLAGYTTGIDDSNYLTFTALPASVPEPATAAMLVGFVTLTVTLATQRRRTVRA